MAKVQSFSELMGKRKDALVEHSNFESTTRHAVFDADKVEYPENVTAASLETHLDFVKSMSAAVDIATAEIARKAYADNNEITQVSGSLSLPGVQFNSEHSLKREVGDETYYGISTTAVDYSFSEEGSAWLDAQQNENEALAKKLFS